MAFTDDAYNKFHTGLSAGTLIGNWQEEQVIRDVTGEGRTVPARHLPRSGLLKDWTKTPPSGPRKMDNTFERVYGGLKEGMPISTYKAGCIYDDYKVDKEGPKETMMQARRYEEAERLVQSEEAVVEELSNARDFNTTTGVAFTEKPTLERLEHLRMSYTKTLHQGMTPDEALAADNQGIAGQQRAHYSHQEAITHHRMTLADPESKGDVKASLGGGMTAFGRNSAFTKPMSEFRDGLYKDEAVDNMQATLRSQGSNTLKNLGGSLPRGGTAFASVPSLTALKEALNVRVAEAFGPSGYVTLRQELFNCSSPEGTVPKEAVASIFRERMQLTFEEVSEMALDVYLSQMCTTKGDELRIGTLMLSLRPALAQRDKLMVLDAFKAMGPMGGTNGVGGSVPLEAWLPKLQDDDLKEVILYALGAIGLPEGSVRISERAFLELCADLAPLMDLSSLL
jgi:hypothetical protein